MSKNKVLVIDLGNGWGKFATRSYSLSYNDNNVLVMHPSNITFIEEPSVYLVYPKEYIHDDDMSITYNYVQMDNGDHFIFGYDAKRSGLSVSDLRGSNRYIDTTWWYMLDWVLGRVGISEGDNVSILLFAPPAYVDTLKRQIKDNLFDAQRRRCINYNGEQITFNIDMAGVMPEAVASAAAYLYNRNGQINPNTVLREQNASVIIDSGSFTLDVVRLIGEQWQNAGRSTYDTHGFYMNVVLPVFEAIKSEHTWVMPHHIDEMMIHAQAIAEAKGLQWPERYALTYREPMDGPDLTSFVQQALQRLYHRIKTDILQPEFNNLSHAHNVILVGGGAYHLRPLFEHEYNTESYRLIYPYEPTLPSHSVNALGGTSYIMRQIYLKASQDD